MAHKTEDLKTVIVNQQGQRVAEFEVRSFEEMNSMNDAVDLGIPTTIKAKRGSLKLFLNRVIVEEE